MSSPALPTPKRQSGESSTQQEPKGSHRLLIIRQFSLFFKGHFIIRGGSVCRILIRKNSAALLHCAALFVFRLRSTPGLVKYFFHSKGAPKYFGTPLRFYFFLFTISKMTITTQAVTITLPMRMAQLRKKASGKIRMMGSVL